MKIYVVILLVLSFVNCLPASRPGNVESSSFSVRAGNDVPFSDQRQQLYKDVIKKIIDFDLLKGLTILQQNDLRYQNWTVQDYEQKLRSYIDGKLVLSNLVHDAIANCLYNMLLHNQLEDNISQDFIEYDSLKDRIFATWTNAAESLKITQSSITAVKDKINKNLELQKH